VKDTLPRPFPTVDGLRFSAIHNYAGYAVSDDGRVWSCRHKSGLNGWWREMRSCGRAKYRSVTLCNGRSRKTFSVHRLVLESFVRLPHCGLVACHGNGNCHDNRLSNLRWDTQANNHRDSIRHGTWVRGESCGKSKLTNALVCTIRHERAFLGTTFVALGRKFGVSDTTISGIVKRKTWKHI
jgi:HNH endonuclease